MVTDSPYTFISLAAHIHYYVQWVLLMLCLRAVSSDGSRLTTRCRGIHLMCCVVLCCVVLCCVVLCCVVLCCIVLCWIDRYWEFTLDIVWFDCFYFMTLTCLVVIGGEVILVSRYVRIQLNSISFLIPVRWALMRWLQGRSSWPSCSALCCVCVSLH